MRVENTRVVQPWLLWAYLACIPFLSFFCIFSVVNLDNEPCIVSIGGSCEFEGISRVHDGLYFCCVVRIWCQSCDGQYLREICVICVRSCSSRKYVALHVVCETTIDIEIDAKFTSSNGRRE